MPNKKSLGVRFGIHDMIWVGHAHNRIVLTLWHIQVLIIKKITAFVNNKITIGQYTRDK
jgi:hypothetical protein